MGEAKRRHAEIDLLKAKGPKEKKRLKKLLGRVTVETLFHFRSAAARSAMSILVGVPTDLNSSAKLTKAVKERQIPPHLVHAVRNPILTPVVIEPSRPPRQAVPIRLVFAKPLTPEEFATHVIALAQMVPSGFRQPSAKEKNFGSTSLAEQAAIRAGMIQPTLPTYSKRGHKKLEARREANEVILAERDKVLPLKYMHGAAKHRAAAQADQFFKKAA